MDLDGHLDLLVVNGAVKLVETAAVSDDPYAIPDQLWLNQGPPGYRFQEASSVAGDALTSTWTSRGAAFGDVDLDGDIDLLINQRDGPTRLLRNTWRRGGDWITLELRGATPNTRAVGAVVTIRLSEEDPPLRRRVGGDGSYLAANDLRLHVGLGRRAEVVNVTVAWPTGHVGFFEGLATNRQHLLHEQLGAP